MKLPLITLFLAFFIGSASTAFGQNYQLHEKYVASDRSSSDQFGELDADGFLVAVGAPWKGGGQVRAGAVYLFKETGGGFLTESAKIVADPKVASEYFGTSVAISGSHLVVGAPGYSTVANKRRGQVYFFHIGSGSNWVQTGQFAYPDSSLEAAMGTSVDIMGDWAVVGCPGKLGLNDIPGYAYLYQRNTNGVWIEKQRLQSPDLVYTSGFGEAIHLDGNTLAISAPRARYVTSSGTSLPQAGKVFLFQLDANGTWNLIQEVASSNPGDYRWFGTDVVLEGNHLAVAASSEDGVGIGGNSFDNSGALYLYERNASNQFVFQQKITSSEEADFQFFGQDLAMENGNLLVGAKTGFHPLDTVQFAGAGFLYQLQNGTWTEMQKLVAHFRYETDHLGGSVAIRGDQLLMGANGQDYDEFEQNPLGDAGAFYTFASVPITQTPSPFSVVDEIIVFPNPTKGMVDLFAPDNEVKHLRLLNSLGQLFMEVEKPKPGTLTLDLSQLASGVYWLEITSKNKGKTLKRIVKSEE